MPDVTALVQLVPLNSLPAYPNIDIDPDEVFDRKAQDWTEALIPLTEQENANIATYNANLPAINTVLGITGEIKTVSSISADVVRVSVSANNIDRVHTSVAQVDRLAVSAPAIDRVHESITKIDAVNDHIANVDTVAANITDVQITASNIQSVIDAKKNADEAKYWAEQAEGSVNIGPATTDKAGIARIATLAEAKSGVSGLLIITPETLKDRLRTAMNLAQSYYFSNTGGF